MFSLFCLLITRCHDGPPTRDGGIRLCILQLMLMIVIRFFLFSVFWGEGREDGGKEGGGDGRVRGGGKGWRGEREGKRVRERKGEGEEGLRYLEP